jgi:hypothetical protein
VGPIRARRRRRRVDEAGGWIGASSAHPSKIEARGQMLHESLASHGVETTLVGMTVGPTVTRYELELGPA